MTVEAKPFGARVALGRRAEKTWSLAVTRCGQPPRLLAGVTCQSGRSSPDRIGVVSNADRSTAIDLDDLAITDRP